MTDLTQLARAELPHRKTQREQNAAAVSPHSPAAASPSNRGELLPIGPALAAIIAGLPVPLDLERQ